MTATIPVTMTLASLDPNDPDLVATVGGKGAGLALLHHAGMPVPDGFCVTTTAYRQFVAGQELEPAIRAAIQGRITPADLAERFFDAPVPVDLATAILDAYSVLSQGDAQVAVAVRSSGTAEDLAAGSAAGQGDSYLGVSGPDAVLEAVRRCWASLWNAHAIAYRSHLATGDGPLDTPAAGSVEMAVVVQRLVIADAAGVVFTADPVSGRRDQYVVNATWGLGEALVGGEVTPDHIVLDAATGAVVAEHLADKHVMTVRSARGTTVAAVPEEIRAEATLSDDDLRTLWRFGTAIHEAAGEPMDIEWARDGEQIWIVQARPITALPPDLWGMEWSREMLIERYPDPLTPMTWSAVSETFFRSLAASVRALGGTLPTEVPLVRLIHGRAYINVTAFQRGMSTLPLRPPVARQSEGAATTTGTSRPATNPLAALQGVTALVRLVLGTHRDWERRLPGYVTATAAADAADWAALDARGLLAASETRRELLTPMLDNHARAIVAGDLTLQLLGALATRWLGDTDGTQVLTLISGLTGNRTVETNHALWLLAERARRHPALAELVRRGTPTPAQLAATAGGPEFADELALFLHDYGHRSPRYEFRHPTWRDDPVQVIDLIRLQLDGTPDPLVAQAEAAERRMALTRQIRGTLPLARRLVFDRVLALTQTYFRLRENQQFYLVLGTPGMRAMLAAMGARLTATGRLTDPDDIYFLERPEVDELLRGLTEHTPEQSTKPASEQHAQSTRALVARRRATIRRQAAGPAPLHLDGTSQASADPATRGAASGSTSGAAAPTPAPGSERQLHGIPASRGTSTGRARVVRGPEDFATLQPGEILVAPATTPAWTPLFAVAAGLVTEFGGLLSHAGVVAREYGLPAVLGVDAALGQIATGDRVTIDGGTGAVLVRPSGDDPAEGPNPPSRAQATADR
jgi:phosphohistidine swiveling domain-containing protein